VPGYAATLAALDDDELARLLERRRDLLAASAPSSFAELASRAGSPASLAAAIAMLDRGALQLAELVAVVGPPTTVEALAEAAGPGLDRARLEEGLERLAELGLAVTSEGGVVSGPRGLSAPFGDPGALGPSVAELAKVAVTMEQLDRIARRLGLEVPAGARKADLVTLVSRGLADPAILGEVLAAADEPSRRLLDQALAAPGAITVMGVDDGRFARHPDAEPASWLLAHGLLLPATYSRFVVPREARIGLRGGLVFPDWPPPPRIEPLEPVDDAAGRAGAAAMHLVLATEGLLGRLDRDPLPLTQTGTVAVRDLKRLARELELRDDELALLVDLLVEAGLLAVGGSWEHRTLGLRPEADAWLAGGRAARWADLAIAWRGSDLAFEDHLAARHGLAADGAERARALGGNRRSSALVRRRGLLASLADLPEGSAASGAGLADLLAWRQPLAWADGHRGAAMLVVDAAKLLGLAVEADGRVAPGPAAPAWAAGSGPAELADRMRSALPDGSDRLLIAGDLTVVAPDGLAPAVAARLCQLADREPAGAWRLHEPSLRRAFDEGSSADEVLGFLRDHTATPLPQALEYLVKDIARRHGRLRVGGAATYLRGDPALVAAAVRSAGGRRLGLRELAPGVAVTSRSQRDLLAALRKSGESPLAEEADGTPRPESRKPVRHPGRAYPFEVGAARAADGDGAAVTSAELVARLRTGDGQRARAASGAGDRRTSGAGDGAGASRPGFGASSDGAGRLSGVRHD
jgi:Helicase conserved C-terminal domain